MTMTAHKTMGVVGAGPGICLCRRAGPDKGKHRGLPLQKTGNKPTAQSGRDPWLIFSFHTHPHNCGFLKTE